MDPSSILWMYHGHIDESGESNAGLVGPIIVTKPTMARADATPKDVDLEFVNLFTVFDENRSPYIDHNIQKYIANVGNLFTDPEVLKEDSDFHESNLMHSINGYVFGNLPGLVMDLGERVRWYIIAMGTEVDLHTPHWHGQTLLWGMMRTDVIEILPGSMKTLDMTPDNPGTWLYHCHVNDHIDAGMLATFTVK
jgi:FtsP/CotA-like multicopper oxidase with cupredoxin domain